MKQRPWFSAAVTVATLSLALLVASPAGAAGGRSDAAHACAQGGYETLQGTDGTRFENTGECVSFVARGGTITNVTTTCSYTAGTSGCFELDDVYVGLGSPGSASVGTTLAGMVTFAPVTSWEIPTTVSVSGSGTWLGTDGKSGTWTATARSSIYPSQFYIAGTFATFTTCGLADTRTVGVHLDVYENDVHVGGIELGLRDATWGINYVIFQGFSVSPSGEPWGLHHTTSVGGVTLRC